MRQEDCSTLWDPQQKMLDGRMWSVCNVGPQVCSVEQTDKIDKSSTAQNITNKFSKVAQSVDMTLLAVKI